MNHYVTQQLAGQHEADLRRLATRGGQASLARQARQARSQHGRRSHPVRRRAGWALISLGMRLAYTAGEE